MKIVLVLKIDLISDYDVIDINYHIKNLFKGTPMHEIERYLDKTVTSACKYLDIPYLVTRWSWLGTDDTNIYIEGVY